MHAVGGWVGLTAVLLLGARRGRYSREGAIAAHPPSSIPFLALGAWILTVGWFGFNVMSAQTIDKISFHFALETALILAIDPGGRRRWRDRRVEHGICSGRCR